MKFILPSLLLGAVGLCSPAAAQLKFSAADLPHKVGAFFRAYANTSDSDVTGLVGSKGGPQRWDFSAQRSAAEDVHRIDTVATADGGHGGDFPVAAYAERTTHESDARQSWSYFSVVPNLGRAYFHFYDPIGNSADPLTVFDQPTVDLPASIAYGQSWQRTVDFQDVLDAGFAQLTVVIHFTSKATVDAYGTLVLPGLREVPALRVNEVNSYETQDTTLGLPLGTQYFRNYYFLVKGIGKAVHIVSKAETSVPSESFKTAATVLRAFERSIDPDPPARSVADLRIALKGRELFLSWARDPNASGYRVEYAPAIAGTNWMPLEETSDSFLFTPLPSTDTARFFRALVKP